MDQKWPKSTVARLSAKVFHKNLSVVRSAGHIHSKMVKDQSHFQCPLNLCPPYFHLSKLCPHCPMALNAAPKLPLDNGHGLVASVFSQWWIVMWMMHVAVVVVLDINGQKQPVLAIFGPFLAFMGTPRI